MPALPQYVLLFVTLQYVWIHNIFPILGMIYYPDIFKSWSVFKRAAVRQWRWRHTAASVTAAVKVIIGESTSSCRLQGCRSWGGPGGPGPDFGRSLPVSQPRRADYAHKITTCPQPPPSLIFRPFYGPALGFDDIRPRRLKCGQALLNFVQKFLLKHEQNKKYQSFAGLLLKCSGWKET